LREKMAKGLEEKKLPKGGAIGTPMSEGVRLGKGNGLSVEAGEGKSLRERKKCYQKSRGPTQRESKRES